ncbi:MAG: glutaredoxin family protein [Candidatus Aenigmatarchaeota archaeon]|nr:MAG: glutaredoxin family protein [Candidatus Aenigmarchaeota archaeon]
MPKAKVNEVKVYSTPTCPFCAMAKKFLKEHKIKFEDVNVATDREAAREMIEKSGQMGVPVIDINGKIVIGFEKEKIKKLLNIKD